MPDSPTAAVARLAAGVTVVTATRRLARELRRAFDEQQSAAGRCAWESADVLPYPAFLARAWQRVGAAGDGDGGRDKSGDGDHAGDRDKSGDGDHARARPLLLNEWQQNAVWESVIADDIRAHEREVDALWNTHATARRAVDAWRAIHDWRIGLNALDAAAKTSRHRDHQCWLRWARDVERRCAARGWLDPARLARRLCGALAGFDGGAAGRGDGDAAGDAPAGLAAALPGNIAFSGFDFLSPQQKALVDALRAAGVTVTVDGDAENRFATVDPPPAADSAATVATDSTVAAADAAAAENPTVATPHRRVFPDQSAQWLAAAAWAHEKLRANPAARIAVIAPDLAGAAARIEAALKQTLCPQLLLDPADAAPLPYHIALGAPLQLHPVAGDALNALASFGGRPLPAEAVGRLLLSPFIAAAEREADARAKLEMACRRRLPHQIRFAQLAAQLADERGVGTAAAACPRLLAALRAALAALQPSDQAQGAPNRNQPASHWARRFDDFLAALGWPGEALSSAEFQAANALRRELHNLATLDLAAPPMRGAEALAWLRRRAGEQAFQAEARGAAVQVLSVSEAAGQRFDALWFGDLTEAEWPRPARPNPFIDLETQRHAGLPAASTELNRAHAEVVHRRLLASADEVVLSRPAFVDEVAAEASALFHGDGDGGDGDGDGGDGDGAAETVDDAAEARAGLPACVIHAARPRLESLDDARAPALADAGAESVPGATVGGVAVIENQAKCPFRAFALHRLNAREVEPNEQGLGAAERGSLLHHALQLVWEKIASSAQLGEIGAAEQRAIVDAAAAQAARRYAVSSGCGARFGRVQARWVADTLDEWLRLERERGEFSVAGLEAETTVAVGGLKLACKIDRIDRLAGGAAALIDYKTGAPETVRNWAGPRPQSPQLPLYALGLEQDGAGADAGDAAADTGSATVAAIVYGKVKRGDCGFSGVGDGEFGPGVSAVEASRSLKNDFGDWGALLAHWRRALPALADEFSAGVARVDPYRPEVCARCNLHTLCRIDAGQGRRS
ncbi:MAG: PD-(D/E)XK nuclease family protein [Gammaproteobacteria bacterium]|nr:PD-(D/E)XK nuclease family protein [Gammaproteobacteria bacterium]